MSEFRKMRKKTRLTASECENILKRNYFMTVSVKLKNGWPYLVTLNYLYMNGYLYFHCARQGQKIDAFAYDPRVCVSIVDEVKIIHELASTKYKSVIVFGVVDEIKDINTIKKILMSLVTKYSSGLDEAVKFRKQTLDKTGDLPAVFRIKIQHITGKYFPEK